MVYYPRALEMMIPHQLVPGKVLLVLGARRVGKTMLLNRLISGLQEDVLLLNGEDMETAHLLEMRSVEHYNRLIGTHSILIIDEAQKIPDIGLISKLIIDSHPNLRMLLTGSSSFDLYRQAGEPLTGRKHVLQMYPLSLGEFLAQDNYFITRSRLADRMVLGSYPEVWQLQDRREQITYLKELAADYLLKDILQYDGIRNAMKIRDLLRLIALQTGREVSHDELARQLGLARKTVENYLDVLAKVFVLVKVEGFSRNLRKEITKMSRWYFLDTGIRNVFAGNLSDLAVRADTEELWENYCISERIKFLNHKGLSPSFYFWRTYDQQEIDWIEVTDGNLSGFEFKWSKHRVKAPGGWQRAYPETSFTVIHPENYIEWLT